MVNITSPLTHIQMMVDAFWCLYTDIMGMVEKNNWCKTLLSSELYSVSHMTMPYFLGDFISNTQEK